MSRRRTPRRSGEESWVVWGCALPTIGCLVVLLVVTIALWTFLLDGGVVDGIIWGLIVFGGIAGLMYAVTKHYS
jgi:hypothetical protein